VAPVEYELVGGSLLEHIENPNSNHLELHNLISVNQYTLP